MSKKVLTISIIVGILIVLFFIGFYLWDIRQIREESGYCLRACWRDKDHYGAHLLDECIKSCEISPTFR